MDRYDMQAQLARDLLRQSNYLAGLMNDGLDPRYRLPREMLESIRNLRKALEQFDKDLRELPSMRRNRG